MIHQWIEKGKRVIGVNQMRRWKCTRCGLDVVVQTHYDMGSPSVQTIWSNDECDLEIIRHIMAV